MLGRKELVQGYECVVIFLVIVAQRLVVITDVEMGEADLVLQTVDSGLGNVLVKEIGGLARNATFLKIGELLYKVFVLSKFFLEQAGIENKPFIYIGSNKMLDFEILVGNAFAQIVQLQFLEGFGVDITGSNHSVLFTWLLGLDNNANGTGSRLGIVDNKVVAAFGVDEMIGAVIGIGEEFGNEVFVKFFALGFIDIVEQAYKVGFENLYIGSVGFNFEICLV